MLSKIILFNVETHTHTHKLLIENLTSLISEVVNCRFRITITMVIQFCSRMGLPRGVVFRIAKLLLLEKSFAHFL